VQFPNTREIIFINVIYKMFLTVNVCFFFQLIIIINVIIDVCLFYRVRKKNYIYARLACINRRYQIIITDLFLFLIPI